MLVYFRHSSFSRTENYVIENHDRVYFPENLRTKMFILLSPQATSEIVGHISCNQNSFSFHTTLIPNICLIR